MAHFHWPGKGYAMRNRPTILLVFLVCWSPMAHMHAQDAKQRNALVTALAFTHRYGLPSALTPDKDRSLKVTLINGFAGQREIPSATLADWIESHVLQQLLKSAKTVDVATMGRLVDDNLPATRLALHTKVRQHADLLTTQFDLIEETQRKVMEPFVAWLVANYHADKPTTIIVICTHNTRRSMLGATMGNVAAAYYGLPNIRFFSGGTDPRAFNPRTIATLREIGIDITKTDREAPRGSTFELNPIYQVAWGKELETLEFSKKYTDMHNPQEKFAAILACSEADAACPKVSGAALRIPVPYLDPKAYDDAPIEAAKYAERRDDVGRFMLSVMLQTQRRIESKKVPK